MLRNNVCLLQVTKSGCIVLSPKRATLVEAARELSSKYFREDFRALTKYLEIPKVMKAMDSRHCFDRRRMRRFNTTLTGLSTTQCTQARM